MGIHQAYEYVERLKARDVLTDEHSVEALHTQLDSLLATYGGLGKEPKNAVLRALRRFRSNFVKAVRSPIIYGRPSGEDVDLHTLSAEEEARRSGARR